MAGKRPQKRCAMTSTTLQSLEQPALPVAMRGPLTRPGPRQQPKITGIPLTQANLPALAPRIAVPGYDRATLSTGVVHLGVGNFHRAHQAVYFDALARLGMTGWGITGIGLRSRRFCELLPPQDLLFTVAELSAAGPGSGWSAPSTATCTPPTSPSVPWPS